MNAGLYVEVNLVCSLFLILFIYKIETNVDIRRRHHLLIPCMMCFLILFISDMIWALIDGGIINAGTSVNNIVNCTYFCSTGLGAFIWFYYCSSKMNSVLINNKFLFSLCSIPCIILIAATVNSPITHWIFYIDANNDYHRGSLYLVQVIVSYGYIFITSLMSLINAFRKQNIAKKHLYISYGMFMIFPLLSVVMQLFLPGYPIVAVGLTLPAACVYLAVADSRVMTDDLTLLHNMNWFFRFHEDFDPFADDQVHYHLLLLDIDHLFLINSKYGKEYGDDSLKMVAQALNELSRKYYLQTARFGGDEFAIIAEIPVGSNTAVLQNDIQRSIRNISIQKDIPYDITVSIGSAMYSEDIPYLEDLIKMADEEMYKVKKSKNLSFRI